MSVFARGRAELEVFSDSAYQTPVMPKIIKVFTETTDDYRAESLTVADSTDTAVCPTGWTSGKDLLIDNLSDTAMTVKGVAGDTGIVIGAGGILLLTEGTFTSTNLLLNHSGGADKVVRVYMAGT